MKRMGNDRYPNTAVLEANWFVFLRFGYEFLGFYECTLLNGCDDGKENNIE